MSPPCYHDKVNNHDLLHRRSRRPALMQTLRTAKLYVALFLMDLLCDAGLYPFAAFRLLSADVTDAAAVAAAT
ncbi:hypothetical protein [Herbaspirillum rhizosphaerae]|uniref:hypothetical protein n=1 Tax=Herbaspirillum rhizosphaerae TaxID=346179 RepID=UPI0012ED89C0|nr:hypothetical protein [Herbaspirillum rhizosphaerae]